MTIVSSSSTKVPLVIGVLNGRLRNCGTFNTTSLALVFRYREQEPVSRFDTTRNTTDVVTTHSTFVLTFQFKSATHELKKRGIPFRVIGNQLDKRREIVHEASE